MVLKMALKYQLVPFHAKFIQYIPSSRSDLICFAALADAGFRKMPEVAGPLRKS